MVPTVKVSDAMRRSIESTLSQTPARYPLTRTVMQTPMIPAGTTSSSIPSMFTGNLPHTIIVAMVENQDRTPNYGKNPFSMHDFGMNRMVVYRNNEAVNYTNGLNVNFTNDGELFSDG